MAVVIAGRNAPVLARRPERLLVEGCRAWANGFETGCVDCWEYGLRLLSGEVGPREARRLAGELAHFVRVTRAAASRPIGVMPYGCPALCRDECLLLAAVACRQNADLPGATAAARHLAPDAAALVEGAAAEFGEALQSLHQQLLPVPLHVIEDIATRPPAARFN